MVRAGDECLSSSESPWSYQWLFQTAQHFFLPENVVPSFTQHVWWDLEKGWKNLLNNLRLVMQPFISFNLLKPWLDVFPIPRLSLGFPELIAIMNQLRGALPRASPIEE